MVWGLTLKADCGIRHTKPILGLALKRPGSFCFCSLGNHSPYWKEVWLRLLNDDHPNVRTGRSHMEEHYGAPVKVPAECNLLGELSWSEGSKRATRWAQTTPCGAETRCPCQLLCGSQNFEQINGGSFLFCSWIMAISRGKWDTSSPTRDWTCTPCIGKQSLNHWTSREVPKWWLF